MCYDVVWIIYFSQHQNFIIFGSIFPSLLIFPKNFARIKINVRSYSVEKCEVKMVVTDIYLFSNF